MRKQFHFFLFWLAALLLFPASGSPLEAGKSVVLEDFSNVDQNGLPAGWIAQREHPKPAEIYHFKKEGARHYLHADGQPNRIFKKIKWNPNQYPFLTWKWRMKNVPADPQKERNASFYVSLGTDLLGIPKITKYAWSSIEKPGSETSGGIFRPTTIVLRSGPHETGEWVTETVNVAEDYKRLHEEDPPDEAYGIGLMTTLEAEFSEIIAHN
jgi:hypothetical protein